jgi:hypothetical protein
MTKLTRKLKWLQNTHLRLSATPTSVALLLFLQYIIATPAMHLTRITKRQYGFRGIHLKAPQLWILGGILQRTQCHEIPGDSTLVPSLQ